MTDPCLVPADVLSPPSNKIRRSAAAEDLSRRDTSPWAGNYLHVGDQPWYCFWKSTVNEFWIFLDQNMDDANQTSAPSTNAVTSTSTPVTASPPQSTSFASPPMYDVSATGVDPSLTTSYSVPTIEASWSSSTYAKRQISMGSANYPKLIKMVDKRKPDNNIQPYCQQMQVLNDWQIMPIPDVPTIYIEETDYSQAAATGNSRMFRRRSGDTIQELDSNCVCEWFSI